ncbi:alpha/beta fold hydrolase [Rhodopseudomonas boonkerdii]|uniref:alpha/beta fold hydrolase n=1 Tax=Rhodopseudomonas boonkerdii TaxID=475937 RepID=UPI001E3A49A6|nr:alpha/beta fold hydrolase [Rhodopseudomonas boonkerdii]UGV27334.1 alpha/beta fold hydrolase [Rhodopseudomonas boonkerdii]
MTYSTPSDRPSEGVVFLHGISRSFRSLIKLQQAVDKAGFATRNIGYPSRHKALSDLADDIHPAIAPFTAANEGCTHFVCHSMGGLLARVYIARHRPARLGRVVMLGTPNGGSEIADALRTRLLYRLYFGPAGQQLVTARDATTESLLPAVDYPVGVIAGNRSLDPIASRFMLPGANDGRVTVARTRLEGMADHIVIPASHAFMMKNKEAIAQTIAFLTDGRFRRADEPKA